MEPTEEDVTLFYTLTLEGNIDKTEALLTNYNFNILHVIKAYRHVLERSLKLKIKPLIREDLQHKIKTVKSNRRKQIKKLNIKNDLTLLEQGTLAKSCSDYLFTCIEPHIPEYASIMFLFLCEINNIEVIEGFIKNYGEYIDYNYVQEDGKNALHIACENDNEDIISLLLTHCNDNKQDYHYHHNKQKRNNTPLHYAVENKNTYVVELLLSNGANPNVQNYLKLSPLHIACQYDDSHNHFVENRSISIIKLLLEYGANPNVFNKGHFTPLHEVEPGPYGNLEIFNLLIHYGASLDNKCNGKTMLYKRVEENDEVGLKFLLHHGANPYTTCKAQYGGKSSTNYYETPFMYASDLYYDNEEDQLKNIKIIQLLYNYMH